MDILEQDQQRATEVIKDLESRVYEEGLRDMGCSARAMLRGILTMCINT